MKNLPMKKTKRMVELRNKVTLGQHETKEFFELRELEFEHNKLDVNFRLSGDNKYYYADQCKRFNSTQELLGFVIGYNQAKEWA